MVNSRAFWAVLGVNSLQIGMFLRCFFGTKEAIV